MKKFLLGVICGVGLTTTTAVFAADTIVTYLFPAKYVFNGESKEMDSEYTTLNYNGHAYVPVRWIAESMGKIVKYDHHTITIAIDDTNLSKKLMLDKDFLSFASEGKLKGIEFGIGANKNDVLQKWGQPQKIGSWQTQFYSWFNYHYFFSNPDQSVGAIMILGGTINYSVDEVKKAIGEPKSEGIDEIQSDWSLYYEAGSYSLYFHADRKNGRINSLMLKKR